MPASDKRDLRANRKTFFLLLVVTLALLGAVSNVVTRTFQIGLSQTGASIQSQDTAAKHQHLDRDAIQWHPPIRVPDSLPLVSFYPRVSPAGPPILGIFLDERLYNRPPPSC